MAAKCIDVESYRDNYSKDDESGESDVEGTTIQLDDVWRLEDLPWFHKGISRNAAEALLLHNAVEGTYLMRYSGQKEDDFSISVRCLNAVKHYALEYDPNTKSYKFGMAMFPSLAELIDHFHCEPVLGGFTGSPHRLRYPYLKRVEEPNTYDIITVQTEVGDNICPDVGLQDLQIGSNEGYLIKRGAIHKNWKKRWFVLEKNLLSYYKKKNSSQPINTINLRLATDVAKDDMDGKRNCFNLVLPKRTYYFHAICPEEAESWTKLLQWKINYYTKLFGKAAAI